MRRPQSATLSYAIFLLAVLSSCSTAKIEKNWKVRQENKSFKQEKALFKERLGGKLPCWTVGVVNFTWQTEAPSKECLYPAGGFVRTEAGAGQYPQLLKVLQATPNGFLVEHVNQICQFRQGCYDQHNSNLVFVHKTTEENVVDGSYLDKPNDGALYEYAGPFTYQSATGTRTVHSFKKLPPGTLKNAMKGFRVYDPTDEFRAELLLWDDLEKSLNTQGQ